MLITVARKRKTTRISPLLSYPLDYPELSITIQSTMFNYPPPPPPPFDRLFEFSRGIFLSFFLPSFFIDEKIIRVRQREKVYSSCCYRTQEEPLFRTGVHVRSDT